MKYKKNNIVLLLSLFVPALLAGYNLRNYTSSRSLVFLVMVVVFTIIFWAEFRKLKQ